MKKIAKIFLPLALWVCLFFTLTFNASAASLEKQDGLEVTITTDKTEYTADEDIQVSVSIKNTNSYKVEDVSIETLLSEGLVLKSGNISKMAIDVEANKSYSTSVFAQLSGNLENIEETKPEETATQNNNATKPSQTGTVPTNTTQTGNNSIGSPKTGDITKIIFGIVLLIAVVVAIIFKLKHKKAAQVLSIFLCFAMALTVLPISAFAAQSDENTIEVDTKAKVDGKQFTLTAKVIYKLPEKNKPTQPENPSEADKYYFNNSEVLQVIDAEKSKDLLTEKEAKMILEERGFGDYPITYNQSIDGAYCTETDIDEGSTEKHPMYQTYYKSEKGEAWVVYIINGAIFANPVSFNLQSDFVAQLLIAESETLTSYDDKANKFYVTIPYENAIIVKTADKIDADTLDSLTIEVISKL